MLGLLFLLFTLIPAIEIYLLFTIGGEIGGANTLMIVIITGFVGAYLAKSQGLSILAKIQTEMNQGKMPTNQLVHGLLVFGGGLLLLTPGFLTDVLGLSMVFPGSRHLIILTMKDAILKSVSKGNVQMYTFSSGEFRSQDFGRDDFESFTQQRKGPTQVGPDTFEAEYSKKD